MSKRRSETCDHIQHCEQCQERIDAVFVEAVELLCAVEGIVKLEVSPNVAIQTRFHRETTRNLQTTIQMEQKATLIPPYKEANHPQMGKRVRRYPTVHTEWTKIWIVMFRSKRYISFYMGSKWRSYCFKFYRYPYA